MIALTILILVLSSVLDNNTATVHARSEDNKKSMFDYWRLITAEVKDMKENVVNLGVKVDGIQTRETTLQEKVEAIQRGVILTNAKVDTLKSENDAELKKVVAIQNVTSSKVDSIKTKVEVLQNQGKEEQKHVEAVEQVVNATMVDVGMVRKEQETIGQEVTDIKTIAGMLKITKCLDER